MREYLRQTMLHSTINKNLKTQLSISSVLPRELLKQNKDNHITMERILPFSVQLKVKTIIAYLICRRLRQHDNLFL